MRAYYRTVVRSYLSSLRRTDGIRALYAFGSYVGGNFRPGRSDVDFVAVTDASTAAREVELLLRLRGPYRRHQGLLPIDVWELPAGELDDTAGWIGAMRPRAGETQPRRSVGDWKLLQGQELRSRGIREPDPRLATVGDYFIREAIRRIGSGRGAGRKVAFYLAEVQRVEREGFTWRSLEDLRRARTSLARGSRDPAVLEAALHATLRVVDDHRRQHALPYEDRLTVDGGAAIPDLDERALTAARRLLSTLDSDAAAALRSATVYAPLPFTDAASNVLLECEDAEAAIPVIRWLVRHGGADAAQRAGIDLQLLTTRLAEDLWRSHLHSYAVAGGGRCLLGEDLAGRIRLPAADLIRELAHYEGFWGAAFARWVLLGQRNTARIDKWPLRIAAQRLLAMGQPPILDPRTLMREVPELCALGSDDPAFLGTLDDAIWARVSLEIWRAWPPVG